jgi:hypothetical protein
MELPEIRCILPISGKELLFKTITTTQQKAIVKAFEKEDNILAEHVFDSILRECCLTSNFNPHELYSFDRHYILIQLRIESVKEDFLIDTNCPSCNAEYEAEFDLSEFDFLSLINSDNEREIKITESVSIRIDFPKRKSEIELSNLARKVTKSKTLKIKEGSFLSNDFYMPYYASHIKSVIIKNEEDVIEESPSLEEITSILENLSPMDFEKVKESINGTYDIKDVGFNCNCKPCKAFYEHSMNWNEFFYRTMIGDINFQAIFQEIGTLCFSEQIGFVKEDIENMAPFERQGYIDYFSALMKEQKKKMEEETKNQGSQSHNSL